MTKSEAAKLSSLSEAIAKTSLDAHIARSIADGARKRFDAFLDEIVVKDDTGENPRIVDLVSEMPRRQIG